MLDVLDLLTITLWLLERFDYHRRRGRNQLNSGVTILANKLDSHVHALPCLGSLGNIVTNLLR